MLLIKLKCGFVIVRVKVGGLTSLHKHTHTLSDSWVQVNEWIIETLFRFSCKQKAVSSQALRPRSVIVDKILLKLAHLQTLEHHSNYRCLALWEWALQTKTYSHVTSCCVHVFCASPNCQHMTQLAQKHLCLQAKKVAPFKYLGLLRTS